MPRHPPYTLGKLDLLDRGSTTFAEQAEACTTKHPSTNRKVYFANRCSSDARSDGKTKKIFQKAGIAEVTSC
jgi:hypothetical protein